MKQPSSSKPAYSRPIKPAPRSLVEKGRTNFGTFSAPFDEINPLDASRAFGVPVPRFLKNLRLKEWQAYQFGNRDCFILVVLYNQKAGLLTQFIYYDRRKRSGFKHEKIAAPWSAPMPSTLMNSRACYESVGYRIDCHNLLDRGRLFVDVAIDARRGMPGVYGHFEGLHDAPGARPLVVSLPLAENRGMYSHKCLMPMKGVLGIGDSMIEFAANDSFAIIDAHKGFYPYVLRYDWVTGVRVGGKRGPVGFNLTDNQVIDPNRYNENCLWAGGALHLLPPVKFERPDGVKGDWLIRDRYGMVDLVFTPEMENVIDMNLLFVRTDYHGPFGSFRGTIRPRNGAKVSVDGFFGMGEQKYLRG
jgi:hypothetical protein